MKPKSPWRPLGFAILASGLSFLSVVALSAKLQAKARLRSQEQPSPELWFEPVAPTSPALIAQGRKLFLGNCAHCHGADAHGDEGPDLHDVQVSDRYIKNIILRGRPHEMPSFSKKLGAAEITSLTAYLRSLD